jgi:hypothetical protein
LQRIITACLVVCLSIALPASAAVPGFTASPGVAEGGIVGPDPLVNGDFSAAVPGTAVAPGWYAEGTTDGTPNVVFEDVDGNVKARTLGKGGAFGSPTFLGLANERPVYSGLFDRLTFEVTDLDGEDVANSGMTVILLMYHAGAAASVEGADAYNYALRWTGVSSEDARSGLTLENLDRVTPVNGPGTLPFEFTDEELANEFQLGGLKIFVGSQELYLDDFQLHEPVLFGTYV